MAVAFWDGTGFYPGSGRECHDARTLRALLHTEFAALLARSGVSQAAFARLTGLTPRQVNDWCRSRAAVPPWAALLAVVLRDSLPELLETEVDEAWFRWHEILGVSPRADAAAIRRAMTGLARRYHPDVGDDPEQMVRINKAYEHARQETSPVRSWSR